MTAFEVSARTTSDPGASWPTHVAKWLQTERTISLATANFVGLSYDASEDAVVIPIENRVKLRARAEIDPEP